MARSSHAQEWSSEEGSASVPIMTAIYSIIIIITSTIYQHTQHIRAYTHLYSTMCNIHVTQIAIYPIQSARVQSFLGQSSFSVFDHVAFTYVRIQYKHPRTHKGQVYRYTTYVNFTYPLLASYTISGKRSQLGMKIIAQKNLKSVKTTKLDSLDFLESLHRQCKLPSTM